MNERFQKRIQRRGKLSSLAILALVALLLFPARASLHLARSIDPRLIFSYLIVISCVTFWLYWHDKRRAEAEGWRIPESTLHLAELFGGWPAALLAQRAFRHKISKTRYQVAFWAIVAVHQAASVDFLTGWHYSRAAIRLLQP